MSRLPGHPSARSLPRAVLDALPFNLAVVDADGVIVDTNRSWREFGEANGLSDPTDTIGVDYFDAIESDDEYARRAVEGIRTVLVGRSEVFTLEYPCHSPNERRWFLCRATAFDHGGSGTRRSSTSTSRTEGSRNSKPNAARRHSRPNATSWRC